MVRSMTVQNAICFRELTDQFSAFHTTIISLVRQPSGTSSIIIIL
jgi:hypothetical protein